MRNDLANLWTLFEPAVSGAGYDLVEVESGREEGGWVVRIYIDRVVAEGDPNQSTSVVFEDCVKVSRELSALLDVADSIPQAYRLEVSSPGIERPLRRERDFKRFASHRVKIRTSEAVDGRRNFSGTILAALDGFVEISCEEKSYRVPVASVVRANLVPDWDAEFKKAERSAS